MDDDDSPHNDVVITVCIVCLYTHTRVTPHVRAGPCIHRILHVVVFGAIRHLHTNAVHVTIGNSAVLVNNNIHPRTIYQLVSSSAVVVVGGV